LVGQALKGEPRERAGLKHVRETIEGGKRRGPSKGRGRHVTRGRQARGWLLLMEGLRCGGINLEKAARVIVRGRGSGSYSGAGRKPGRGLVSWKWAGLPTFEYHGVIEITRWGRKTHDSLERRGGFERQANRMRGGRRAAMRGRQPGYASSL